MCTCTYIMFLFLSLFFALFLFLLWDILYIYSRTFLTSMKIINILIYVLVALGQEDDVIIYFVYVQVQECIENNHFLLICFSLSPTAWLC